MFSRLAPPGNGTEGLFIPRPYGRGQGMASKRTFICLICQKTLEAHPDFDTYMEAYRHAQEVHGGRLMLDGRQREASVVRR